MTDMEQLAQIRRVDEEILVEAELVEGTWLPAPGDAERLGDPTARHWHSGLKVLMVQGLMVEGPAQISREDGKRRVVSIQEIQGMEGDVITMAEIFAFRRKGLDEDGNVVGEFCATGVVPKFADQLKRRGFPLDLKMFRAFSR